MNSDIDKLDEIVDELYRHFLTDPVGYKGKYEKHTSKAKQALRDYIKDREQSEYERGWVNAHKAVLSNAYEVVASYKRTQELQSLRDKRK